MDCSEAYDNAGCDGGLAANAYDYAKTYGIELESDYPYLAVNGTCHREESKVKAYVQEFYKVEKGSPE